MIMKITSLNYIVLTMPLGYDVNREPKELIIDSNDSHIIFSDGTTLHRIEKETAEMYIYKRKK